MKSNPDIYLLYEYTKKLSFTARLKVVLDEPADAELLALAAQEATRRFPYFAVSLGLDTKGNYTLLPNPRPMPVLPEQDRRLLLGSEETNGHLFAITWRGDTVYLNWTHSICGAFGVLRWAKTTLYQYLTKRYGEIEASADLKHADTPVAESELFVPDPDSLPGDAPIARYTGTNTMVAVGETVKYFLNPFARDSYYYQIDIPKAAFMAYNTDIDASPNSVLAALMFKVCTRLYTPKNGRHIAARIVADFRNHIGCPDSYRDFVRLIRGRGVNPRVNDRKTVFNPNVRFGEREENRRTRDSAELVGRQGRVGRSVVIVIERDRQIRIRPGIVSNLQIGLVLDVVDKIQFERRRSERRRGVVIRGRDRLPALTRGTRRSVPEFVDDSDVERRTRRRGVKREIVS